MNNQLKILQNFLFSDEVTIDNPHILNLFDTHFWKENTTLEELVLEVEYSGELTISAVEYETDSKQLLFEKTFNTNLAGFEQIALDYASLQGVVAVTFKLTKGSKLIGARYLGDAGQTNNNIKVRYTVCTFNRQEYITANAHIFQDFINDQFGNDLSRMTIVNNGDSLGDLALDSVDVVENKNLGGAGGFCRGIFEVLHGRFEHDGTSHIVLMDDDIQISKENFIRNNAILAFLKPNIHLGAAMHGLVPGVERKTRINCFGHKFAKSWHPSDRAIGSGENPKDPRVFAKMDRYPDSTGWWWHCFSVEDARAAGLPYPFFIKMDDVEYSLRISDNGNRLAIPLTLWVEHEDFDVKYSAAMQYFRFRNRWILLAIQNEDISGMNFLVHMWRQFFSFAEGYRYEHAELLLMAVSDFMRGPHHIRDNYAGLLKKVLKVVSKEKAFSISRQEAQEKGFRHLTPRIMSAKRRVIIAITLRGMLHSASRKAITERARILPIADRLDVSSILYFQPEKQCGYIVDRDTSRMLSLLFKSGLLSLQILWGYRAMVQNYRLTRDKLISKRAWHNYFGLQEPQSVADCKLSAQHQIDKQRP
jgi:GT2 family glycosyltransferase